MTCRDRDISFDGDRVYLNGRYFGTIGEFSDALDSGRISIDWEKPQKPRIVRFAIHSLLGKLLGRLRDN